MTSEAGSIEAKPEILRSSHVTNWMPFVARDTAEGFEIAYRETPVVKIWFTTILVGSGAAALAAAVFFLADRRGLWVVIPLGLVTTFGTHYATIAYHKSQQRRGPVLVYNAGEKKVNVARDGVSFRVEEIAYAALVTGGEGDGRHTQLQLHTRNGERFLLVAAYMVWELMPMARAIARQAGIPVRVFVKRGWRKEVWEERTFAELEGTPRA